VVAGTWWARDVMCDRYVTPEVGQREHVLAHADTALFDDRDVVDCPCHGGWWVVVWRERGTNCQGTPAVVPMRVSIRASTLNKGGSGDPGAWSIVSHTHARIGGI
jgi:hypothetical protein